MALRWVWEGLEAIGAGDKRGGSIYVGMGKVSSQMGAAGLPVWML